ncbi:Mediator complex subunit 10 CG5057-PA, partial [Zea mays]
FPSFSSSDLRQHHGERRRESFRCGRRRREWRPSIGGRRGAPGGRVEAEPGAGDELDPEDAGPAPPAQPHRLLLQLCLPASPPPAPSLRKHLLEELEQAFPEDVEAYREIRATSAAEAKRLAQSHGNLLNGDVKVKAEH